MFLTFVWRHNISRRQNLYLLTRFSMDHHTIGYIAKETKSDNISMMQIWCSVKPAGAIVIALALILANVPMLWNSCFLCWFDRSWYWTVQLNQFEWLSFIYTRNLKCLYSFFHKLLTKFKTRRVLLKGAHLITLYLCFRKITFVLLI